MDHSFEQAVNDITWEDVVVMICSMPEDIPNNPPPAPLPSSRASNTANQEVYSQPGAAPCSSQHPLQSAPAPALNIRQPAPVMHLSPMQAGFTPADSAAPLPVSHDHSEEMMNEMEKVEDIFLMYADEDTQDYCTPAYPPSSPPGAHQGPHNVLASHFTSASLLKASTSISEHAAVEVEVKNTMATLWSFPEDSLSYSPPSSPLSPVESAPRSETSTAVPQRTGKENRGGKLIAAPQLTEGISAETPPPASRFSSAEQQPLKVQSSGCWRQSETFLRVNAGQRAPPSALVSTAVPERAAKDVGWERTTATPKYLPPESSASTAPLTIAGPTVNTQSGFTPSESGATPMVSKKRKSMNPDESGPHMKKPRNASVAFQEEERPHTAAAPDISVEANSEDVAQRTRMQLVAPVQRAEMELSTSQFVLCLPYAAVPVATCCIFLQPHDQCYDQYYGQYVIQIVPDNAYYYYHAPTDSFMPRQD